MAFAVFILTMDDTEGTVMETVATTPAPKGGLATTGFILSLCGVIVGWCPLSWWLGMLLGLLGVIFGGCGWRHGLGKAGVILGVVALVFSFLFGIVPLCTGFRDLIDNDILRAMMSGLDE